MLYESDFYFVIDIKSRERFIRALHNTTQPVECADPVDCEIQRHYATSLRLVRTIGLPAWKTEYIRSNYKHINLEFMQNRVRFLFQRAVSNPNYVMCRNRLTRECRQFLLEK